MGLFKRLNLTYKTWIHVASFLKIPKFWFYDKRFMKYLPHKTVYFEHGWPKKYQMMLQKYHPFQDIYINPRMTIWSSYPSSLLKTP